MKTAEISWNKKKTNTNDLKANFNFTKKVNDLNDRKLFETTRDKLDNLNNRNDWNKLNNVTKPITT